MKKLLLLLVFSLSARITNAQVDVLVQRYDNSRTGQNLNESTLTSSTVASSQFGRIYSFAVDGTVYAQPLYVSNLAIPGKGIHNVVLVVTEHDSAYAFDADTATPLWQTSFINPSAGITSIPIADMLTSDLIPDTEVGAMSTPAIDLSSGTMYVVAGTKENGTHFYRLHALDITTGIDKLPPVAIQGSVPGNGQGSTGGTLTFNPAWQLQRPGLVLVNGNVYFGFGSSSDNWQWHGWLFGYNATTLAQVAVFCNTPNDIGGGIWSAGEAPPVDANGNIYYATGNGAFDGSANFGDAFVKLGTANGLQVLDFFAPFNQQAINAADLDIASAGLMLLPDSVGTTAHPHIAVGSGKDGTIYVLDRDNLGGYNGSHTNPDSQIIQEIWNALGIASINPSANTLPYVENNYSTPAIWRNHLYWSGINDRIKMFNISGGLLTTTPVSQSATAYGFGGAQPVVTANGAGATSAILWAVERGTNSNILHAYDASNLATELYNSTQVPTRDAMGPSVKFVVPTVANGKVFVGSQTQIDVFGVLASTFPQAAVPTFTPPGGNYITGQPVTISTTTAGATIYYTVDGSLPTTTSAQYVGPIQINQTTTIRAIAVTSGFLTSPIGVAAYTIGGSLVTTGGFVQGNYSVPQTPQATVTVLFTGPQSAGDMNLVVVGWNDTTAIVNSVVDTAGNTYQLAIGPTAIVGSLSQSIYYASNIVPSSAGSNAVTVKFNTAANFPDIRIAEYGGLDPNNPLDVTAGATGNSGTSNSGSATTTYATELIVGANMVHSLTGGPGGAFISRINTVPDGDILEDMVVTVVGTYSAAAGLNPASGWIMQMATFRAAPAAQIPSAPSNLSVTATGASQASLIWMASTETGGTISSYLVERCSGAGCSNFAQVGTANLPSFGDSGLAASTSYSYRVRAMDSSNNLSPYSGVATVATLPANAPTAPSNLAAGAVSGTQVNLTWTASIPAVGTISNYLIERCTGNRCVSNYAQVGTSTTTAFSDTGLLPSTTYTYRVRAIDSSGNFSPYSSFATATTSGSTVTAPSNLAAVAAGNSQINLSWTAATETGGTISQYLMERCSGASCGNFAQVGTSTTTTFNDSGLLGSTTYNYRVRATDTLNNLGPYSNTASATTAAPTFTAPSNLTATAISNTQINLSWTAATETGGTISQYLVERCTPAACTTFAQVGTATSTTFSDSGLTAATSYSYRVRATDAASDLGPYSNVATAITQSTPPPPPVIAFIQVNSADPQSSPTTVTVPYTAAQRVGDLNVVVVGWNDSTATVNTVTDTVGNVYALAAAPTVQTGIASQSIYYAKNIAAAGAGANSVKVTFNGSAAFPDIRILEYSGLDTANPLDVSAGAQGNSGTASSGSVTTTNANDLIIGANVVQTGTPGPGTGFTSRVITSPDSDIAEDETVTAIGSYSATSPVSPPSAWIMLMVAFKAAGSAPTPTAPSNLTATAAGSVQINLSWTASTESGGTIANYLVERCSGASCSNFVQVGTTGLTTYSDTSGLLGSTSYSYRVRAMDSTNNTGPYSNTASATTAAPTFTVPSGLTATASGPVQVNLAWTAGTETGGTITQYLIERCLGLSCTTFAQVGTSPAATFSDTSAGLLGSTAYNYRVRATDGTNNSGYSNVAPVTTAAPTFTLPSGLTATAAGSTQINLSWTAATETGGTITQYLIESCSGPSCTTFTQIATTAGTTYSNTGLTGSTGYSYRVRATDGTNNSGYSNTSGATTPANTPTAPTNLTAAAAGPVQINLSWTASTESGGTIANYLVERCSGASCSNFVQVGTTAATTFSDSGLLGSTAYNYRVRAMDSTNNTGPYSNTASATTAAPTFTLPSGLTATASGPVQVNLSWTAGTETGGTITQYLIERCLGLSCTTFAQVGTSPAATFSDTSAGLLGSTAYNYRVRATDGTNNSGYSNVAPVTTAAPILTAPSNLAAIAVSNTQINLSWTAATETGSTITQYLIESCSGLSCTTFTQIATTAGTTYSNTGLTAATSYSYRVRATDAASNLGPYSNVATATTQSTPPPPPVIAFIQVNSADPQTSQTTVTVPYTAAQRVGDLNVVVVGWNDSTATVNTVTDTVGNVYALAVGPTVQTGIATQSIYYAKNIVAAGAGANSVKVTFNGSAAFPDIRILEYSGLDTANPLDVSAGAQGNSGTASSGSVTTTSANDLIIGANVVQTGTPGPGTGFTTRIITSPDSDIVEDRVVAVTGSYSATSPVSAPAPWVMQLVAFKAHP